MTENFLIKVSFIRFAHVWHTLSCQALHLLFRLNLFSSNCHPFLTLLLISCHCVKSDLHLFVFFTVTVMEKMAAVFIPQQEESRWSQKRHWRHPLTCSLGVSSTACVFCCLTFFFFNFNVIKTQQIKTTIWPSLQQFAYIIRRRYWETTSATSRHLSPPLAVDRQRG